MRKPSPQPKHTRLPRLHDAKPQGRATESRPRKAPIEATPRVARDRNFRLRNVHRD